MDAAIAAIQEGATGKQVKGAAMAKKYKEGAEGESNLECWSCPVEVKVAESTACEIITPQLTTVRVNRGDIGRLAINTLIDRIENPHPYHIHTQISSDLIIRKSVRDISQV